MSGPVDRDSTPHVAPETPVAIISDEVRRRAAGGAVLVGLRGIAIRAIG
jgi:hypothetical protein